MRFEELLACTNGFFLTGHDGAGGDKHSKKGCAFSTLGSAILFPLEPLSSFIQEVCGYSQLCRSYEKLMMAFSSTEKCLMS